MWFLLVPSWAWAVPVLDVPDWVVRLERANIRVTGANPGDLVGVVMARNLGPGMCAPQSGPCLSIYGDWELLDRPTVAGPGGSVWLNARVTSRLGLFYLQAVVIQPSGVRMSAPSAMTVLGRSDDDDRDGASNQLEFFRGTDPLDPDMDGDGVLDGDDLWPTETSTADVWVVDDVAVSAPGASMPDPEFDTVHHRVVWQSIDGDELWVADVDPVSGAFLPADGRGTLVDTNVAPIGLARNGPEWVQTAAGAHVLYGVDRGHGPEVMLAEHDGVAWQSSSLAPGMGAFGSLQPHDPSPRVYFVEPGPPEVTLTRVLGGVSADIRYPHPLRWGRWIEGTGHLLAVARDAHGIQQVVDVDPQTGSIDWRTSDDSNKRSVFGWFDPERGAEAYFTTRGPSGTEIAMSIDVHLSDGAGGWVLHDVIRSTAAYPFIISPEPFVVDGRSYISFLASRQPENRDNARAEVWVVDIDPSTRWARRVSLPSTAPIKDPEPAVFDDTAFIYYTELMGTERVVHRCATGL